VIVAERPQSRVHLESFDVKQTAQTLPRAREGLPQPLPDYTDPTTMSAMIMAGDVFRETHAESETREHKHRQCHEPAQCP
jgi:hypothetical protein